MYIATRAKVSSRTPDNDGTNISCIREVAEQVPQLSVGIKREWILSVWSVQGNGANLIFDLPVEVLGLVGCQLTFSVSI